MEIDFEADVVRFVEEDWGGWAPKLVIKNQRHFPDRTLILPNGRICFVELKRPDGKGKASKGQEVIIDRLQRLGHVAGFASNFGELGSLLERLH